MQLVWVIAFHLCLTQSPCGSFFQVFPTQGFIIRGTPAHSCIASMKKKKSIRQHETTKIHRESELVLQGG